MTFHMQNFGGKLPSRVNEINTLIILLSTVIHVYFSSFETYKYTVIVIVIIDNLSHVLLLFGLVVA